jgi:uncharacterized repeat protein (TIGR03803 family)
LYGTTIFGGRYNYGTVFKIPTQGKETVLYSFKGGVDGAYPSGGVIADSKGNIYSTTTAGGDLSCNLPTNPPGCGTVFKLGPTGKETVLHSFTDSPDGAFPYVVVRDSLGNLYGTTQGGGSSIDGTVYKLSSTGAETVLYSFTGPPDGSGPGQGVLRDSSGNLYGTTVDGGANYWGTVWEVDSTGKETVLYNFTGGTDGGYPNGGLIRDASGNLYGTTNYGGTFADTGTLFELDGSGNETVLHSFGGVNDGKDPTAGLVRDSLGNMYGTTLTGGEYDWGAVYKLDTLGNETVLYSFTGSTDGAYAIGPLVLDSAGNLYGTTQQGGAYGWGTVFKLTP